MPLFTQPTDDYDSRGEGNITRSTAAKVNSDLQSTDGELNMKILSNPSTATVDIIFVHGLAGKREKTWTHQNGAFWPEHFLPQDFPTARIMTFGYNADVIKAWGPSSSSRVACHGKSLAFAVLDQRVNVEGRPIIFVAHSLGGLVCEAALILSQKRAILQPIFTDTLGVIFLGTPHNGATIAHWGHRIARYISTFRRANADILDTLKPGSQELISIAEDFQHLLIQEDVRIKVFCFYETLPIEPIGIIVERFSAVLSAYDCLPMDADHRNMAKFPSQTDAGYGKICGVLQRWLQENAESVRSRSEPSRQGMNDPGDAAATEYGEGSVIFHGNVTAHNMINGMRGGTINFK